MRQQVAMAFDSVIIRAMPSQNLRKYLLEHERKAICVDRLCDQIQRAEQAANIGRPFDITRFNLFIESTARMFCKTALDHAEQEALSHAEKQRQRTEAGHIEDCKAAMVDLENEATTPKITSYPGGVAR